MNYKSPYNGIDSDHVLYLATNENSRSLPEYIRNQLSSSLSFTNRYPKVDNIQLRKKIAHKIGMNSENIVLGAGSDELLMLLAVKYVKNGDNTIMADPSFFRYKQLTELAGGVCQLIKCKDFNHDLEAMREAVNDRTKIVFICNPNNPTGSFISKDEIEAFVKHIPKEILVVIDEAYFDFVFPDKTKSSIELINQYSNVIVLRTFSKFYSLAALRIGYAIADQKIAGIINSVRSPYNVNALAQEAALLALEDSEFTKTTYNENQKEKEIYYNTFDRLGIKYIPSQANFIFVHFGKNCDKWCESLKKDGIVIRPCDIFGYPEYVRITIGSHQENEIVIKCLEKIVENN